MIEQLHATHLMRYIAMSKSARENVNSLGALAHKRVIRTLRAIRPDSAAGWPNVDPAPAYRGANESRISDDSF